MSTEQQFLHTLEFIKSALWQIFLIVGMALWMGSYIRDHLPKRAKPKQKRSKRRAALSGASTRNLSLLPDRPPEPEQQSGQQDVQLRQN